MIGSRGGLAPTVQPFAGLEKRTVDLGHSVLMPKPKHELLSKYGGSLLPTYLHIKECQWGHSIRSLEETIL